MDRPPRAGSTDRRSASDPREAPVRTSRSRSASLPAHGASRARTCPLRLGGFDCDGFAFDQLARRTYVTEVTTYRHSVCVSGAGEKTRSTQRCRQRAAGLQARAKPCGEGPGVGRAPDRTHPCHAPRRLPFHGARLHRRASGGDHEAVPTAAHGIERASTLAIRSLIRCRFPLAPRDGRPPCSSTSRRSPRSALRRGRFRVTAVESSGISGLLTHADTRVRESRLPATADYAAGPEADGDGSDGGDRGGAVEGPNGLAGRVRHRAALAGVPRVGLGVTVGAVERQPTSGGGGGRVRTGAARDRGEQGRAVATLGEEVAALGEVDRATPPATPWCPSRADTTAHVPGAKKHGRGRTGWGGSCSTERLRPR